MLHFKPVNIMHWSLLFLRESKVSDFLLSLSSNAATCFFSFNSKQGGHKPGKHGKPGKLREFEKLSKSQGKLREILIFVEKPGKLRENVKCMT